MFFIINLIYFFKENIYYNFKEKYNYNIFNDKYLWYFLYIFF